PKNNDIHFSPIAKKIMAAHQISPAEVINHFGSYRVSKKDISNYIAEKRENKPSVSLSSWGGSRDMKKEKMSTLRIKLSQRLVAVKNQTAMLTTFNEVDMSAILTIRKQYKDTFKEKFDVSLGFMSFFTKAITGAINLFPQINSMIDGEEIIIPDYADIGIAVSGPKGLVVPVIRNAEILSLAEIEQKIKELAGKARANRITLEEMSGGTFTITNGGVFGSMLSTPILNPPQSAILGMHNIVERPVAINGKVEIRPVMYVALSYDHRLIDGKESVGFLVKVKEMLENPVKLIFGGNDPIKTLLNL
ncbi:MAG: dihydrolipoyllysine-residue succinyltransferase, partial [Bacteroidales bacterium]|nr:dihydrolipoyllysine-residue succinyltransferase [Bacteroidales bacterium]